MSDLCDVIVIVLIWEGRPVHCGQHLSLAQTLGCGNGGRELSDMHASRCGHDGRDELEL